MYYTFLIELVAVFVLEILLVHDPVENFIRIDRIRISVQLDRDLLFLTRSRLKIFRQTFNGIILRARALPPTVGGVPPVTIPPEVKPAIGYISRSPKPPFHHFGAQAWPEELPLSSSPPPFFYGS
jgi:hypothetical protein